MTPLYPSVNVGEGAYAAHGAGGHYMTILPAHNVVVVHRVNTNDRTVPVGGTDRGTEGCTSRVRESSRSDTRGPPIGCRALEMDEVS